MRGIVPALMGTLAVGIVGAAAKDLKLTRNATSGVDSRIAYERAWDRNCKALSSKVTVTQQPKNGTVSIVEGTSTIPASTPNSGSTSDCAGKTVTGNEVRYKSNAGFRGTDSVTYTVANENGAGGTRVITIVVK
jgi:hypothetical protein